MQLFLIILYTRICDLHEFKKKTNLKKILF